MSGCFSFCLLSYILGIFSKTEQYFLLLDKLLPDSVMASSRPEENVVLNNFQHKRLSVLVYPPDFIWVYLIIILFFGRCYANFCYFSLTDVIIKVYVVDLKPHFGRCYCHICVGWYYYNCCLLIVDIFVNGRCYCLLRTTKEALYIRVNNPSLNRNIGKYHLPHIWDEVLLNISELSLK